MSEFALVFGHAELVRTHKRVGNKLYLGGYSIYYDRQGVEVTRTKNEWNCTLDCGEEPLTRRVLGWLKP